MKTTKKISSHINRINWNNNRIHGFFFFEETRYKGSRECPVRLLLK